MRFRIFLAIFVILVIVLASSPTTMAIPLTHEDEGTPRAEDTDSMPVEIHPGTCGHYELEGVIKLSHLSKPTAAVDSDVFPAATSISTVDVPIDDFLAEPHVVVVHESASAMDTVVACGAIGGDLDEDGLAIGLQPISTETPVRGVAWLTTDGAQTQIAVFLIDQPSQSAAIEVPVTLGGSGDEFSIESGLTTFEAGQLYRFVVTNVGAIPHEFVIGHSLAGIANGEEGEGGMHDDSSSSSADHELVHETSLALIEADDLPLGATVSIDVVFDETVDLSDLEFACHIPGHYEAGMVLPIEVLDEAS